MKASSSTAPRASTLEPTRGAAISLVIVIALVYLGHFFVYPVFLMKLMCYGIFAASFDLLLGYGGMLSFGHAMFFGVAAYSGGWLAKSIGFTPELAVIGGAAMAGVLAWFTGRIAIQRTGIYFAMVTLAIAQMAYFILQKIQAFGGENGLQAIPRGKALGLFDLDSTTAMFHFVFVVFVIALIAAWKLVYSRFGKTLRAVKENEARCISLGYDAAQYKLKAFVASGCLAGVAGATKAIVFQAATLTDAHWTMSGEAVLMSLLGGLGTMLGPVLGASIIVGLNTYLSTLASWALVVHGVIFVLFVIFFQTGIVGQAKAISQKFCNPFRGEAAHPRIER